MSLLDQIRRRQEQQREALSSGSAPKLSDVLRSGSPTPALPASPPPGSEPVRNTRLIDRLDAALPASKRRTDLVSEAVRIVSLPQVDYFGCDLTSEFLRPGARLPFIDLSGSKVNGLKLAQSAMLAAVKACGGAFCPVGVGHGKAGVALIAPTALQAKIGIILTTSGTLTQMRRTYALWRKYFRILDNMHILSYDQLSTQAGTTLLDTLCAGYEDSEVAIVADECHKLKNPTSARTTRFLRFFDGDPHLGTRGREGAHAVALSGTITSKSIRDFSHITRITLRHMAPVPHDQHDLDAWSECLDVEGTPSELHWEHMQPLWKFGGNKDAMTAVAYSDRRSRIRKAFQVRLRSCPGVVATEQQAIGSSLLIHAHYMSVPDVIIDAMRKAQLQGIDPTGEPLPDSIAVGRMLKQLSAGYYYIWDWPNNEPDMNWLFAKSRWYSLVRQELQDRATAHYDSEFLVASKVAAQVEKGYTSDIHIAYRRWVGEREKRWTWPDGVERPMPPTKTIWVDKFFVNAMVKFVASFKEPVILWYESRALQEAFREAGLVVRGAGEDPPDRVTTCALSLRAHADGLNLQGWRVNVMAEVLSSGARTEQVLGRTHRPGSMFDEVEVFLPQHTSRYKQCFAQAREDARYIEDSTGNQQKLNYATLVDFK